MVLKVKAGDKLIAEWHHTLDSTPETDNQDPIDAGHLGPIMVYLAKVDNALTTTVTGLKCEYDEVLLDITSDNCRRVQDIRRRLGQQWRMGCD
jgi:hypothetical protein